MRPCDASLPGSIQISAVMPPNISLSRMPSGKTRTTFWPLGRVVTEGGDFWPCARSDSIKSRTLRAVTAGPASHSSPAIGSSLRMPLRRHRSSTQPGAASRTPARQRSRYSMRLAIGTASHASRLACTRATALSQSAIEVGGMAARGSGKEGEGMTEIGKRVPRREQVSAGCVVRSWLDRLRRAG
jgi:hypothetical protein